MTDDIVIPRYVIPDYTDCFEELRLRLPWGTLKKEREGRGDKE